MRLFYPLLALALLSGVAAASDDAGWTVLFRADDPLIWDHNTGEATAANGYAISTKKAPEKVRFLRLKRMDTGDAVIVKMNRELLPRSEKADGEIWWSGGSAVRGPEGNRNKLLGISRVSWPTTQKDDHLVRRAARRLDQGYRGWGFSKLASQVPDQTCSWDGKPIAKTIFEIAVKGDDLSEAESQQLLKPNPVSPEASGEPVAETPEPSDAGPTTRIARRQTSIKGLYVRETDSGQLLGQASELILTATPGTPRGPTPVSFTTTAGKEMHMVLDDALRWVRIKYPRWDAAKVELSFEDKYTPKDGGSIGAAIGTLLLSMIEGFDVDPKLAITGDVTADGKIRSIGGVAAKTRGATAGGCTVMAVPADNYPQVADAMVWEGPKLLSSIQVIGVANLTEASAVARSNRDEKLSEAMKLFAELQPGLEKSPDSIRNKATIDKLTSIVDLASNHYSAKLLLAVAQGKQPRKLSATASMYYAFVSIGNMGPTLLDRAKKPTKGQVTPAVVKEGLRTLDKVRRLAAPETIPFVNAWTDLIKALNDAETGVGSPEVLKAKLQQVDDAMAKLRTNRDLMEKMLHEGI
jgi:hypothetical protein